MNPFFAMDNGIVDAVRDTPAKQVAMLKELGYDGLSYRVKPDLPQMVEELDKAGLKMFALFTNPTIDADGVWWDSGLESALDVLAGRDVLVWPTIKSNTFGLSDPAGDDRAVELVRRLSDMAGARGLRVALYPHWHWWLERLDDALRVLEKANCSNVGVSFGLCHWLLVEKDGGAGIPDALRRALPHLSVATINGTEPSGDNYATMIQTLDRGAFDVGAVLKLLHVSGYMGPIGLQAYGLEGNVYDNLSRSMGAWRRFNEARSRM